MLWGNVTWCIQVWNDVFMYIMYAHTYLYICIHIYMSTESHYLTVLPTARRNVICSVHMNIVYMNTIRTSLCWECIHVYPASRSTTLSHAQWENVSPTVIPMMSRVASCATMWHVMSVGVFVLQCVAVYCSMLQRAAVCYSVLMHCEAHSEGMWVPEWVPWRHAWHFVPW